MSPSLENRWTGKAKISRHNTLLGELLISSKKYRTPSTKRGIARSGKASDESVLNEGGVCGFLRMGGGGGGRNSAVLKRVQQGCKSARKHYREQSLEAVSHGMTAPLKLDSRRLNN